MQRCDENKLFVKVSSQYFRGLSGKTADVMEALKLNTGGLVIKACSWLI